MQTKKKLFFAKICCKFLAFFRFFAAKTLKMVILTSVWSAQHPNAGRNMQHLTKFKLWFENVTYLRLTSLEKNIKQSGKILEITPDFLPPKCIIMSKI